MITKAQAIAAGLHGGTFYHLWEKKADGSPRQCRASGKCRTWKRNPHRWELPVKEGLYDNYYLTYTGDGEGSRNAGVWTTQQEWDAQADRNPFIYPGYSLTPRKPHGEGMGGSFSGEKWFTPLGASIYAVIMQMASTPHYRGCSREGWYAKWRLFEGGRNVYKGKGATSKFVKTAPVPPACPARILVCRDYLLDTFPGIAVEAEYAHPRNYARPVPGQKRGKYTDDLTKSYLMLRFLAAAR